MWRVMVSGWVFLYGPTITPPPTTTRHMGELWHQTFSLYLGLQSINSESTSIFFGGGGVNTLQLLFYNPRHPKLTPSHMLSLHMHSRSTIYPPPPLNQRNPSPPFYNSYKSNHKFNRKSKPKSMENPNPPNGKDKINKNQ